MFFNDVVAAYSSIPNEKRLISLKKKGYKIALFDDGHLPSYLIKDADVVKISGYW